MTDCFDGAVGRYRQTGLIKWGFYMDHLLDFIFMWCVFVGYVYIIPLEKVWQIYAIAFLYSGLMVNALLVVLATNEFRITYFGLGPTEIRILFICFNTAIIIWGTGVLEMIIPYLAGVLVLTFCLLIYGTHKRLWLIDMRQKAVDGNKTDLPTDQTGNKKHTS